MKPLLQFALVVGTVCAASAQGNYEAVIVLNSSYTVTGSTPGVATAGWTFQPLAPVEVTDLGFVNDLFFTLGNPGTVTVGLWDDAGNLVAQSQVAFTDTLINQTRYHSITPVTLTTGRTYTIAAYSASGAITVHYIDPTVVDIGGQAAMASTIQLGGYAEGNLTFSWPQTVGPTGSMDLGANFRIPEPSSAALVWLGALALVAQWRSARKR